MRESGGRAIAVEEEALLRATAKSALQDGMLLCPEGGATLAAWHHAVAQGWIGAEDEVVLFNCATGLKYPLPAQSATLDKDALPDLASL